MRYRSASNAPGTKRPSANEPDEEEREEWEGVRAGAGVRGAGVEEGVATVCVTRGPPPLSAEPQDRQKRLESGTSFAQARQVTGIPCGQSS